MKNVSSTIHEKIEDKVKVVIPKDVINKIQYLCTVISTVEWSGILFYTVKGTIKNPSKMVITLKDILPMDRGSAASTEFTYDERYVEFLMNNEERLDYKSGLIHSHNNMGVFYSGVDQDELKNNSKSHNFYLSVVVNNKLDIIGRIGISGVAETEVKTYYRSLDEDGKSYNLSPSTLKVKSEKLYYIDCEMEYSIPKPSMEEEFVNNTNIILTKDNKKNSFSILPPTGPYNSPITNYKDNFNYPVWGSNDYDYGNLPKVRKDIKPKRKITKQLSKFKEDEFFRRECEIFLIKAFGFDDPEFDPEFYDDTSLDEVLIYLDSDLEEGELTIPEIIEDFSSNFASIYEQYFHNTVYSTETIKSTIISILEDYEEEYKFIKDIKNFMSKL